MNFNTYKFHCSGLANLMVNGRKKDEVLSETTKGYLRDLWIKEMYARDFKYKSVTKYTRKGIMVESDSLDLVEVVTKKNYLKNLKLLENRWVCGTPDVITYGKVIDIKSSWDLWTFADVTEEKAKKDYFYQLLGYMWLTGKRRAQLMYCLVNTPDLLIEDEIYRLKYLMSEEEADAARINYVYDDIAPKNRLKCYTFKYDREQIDDLKRRILLARAYMNGLKLA